MSDQPLQKALARMVVSVGFLVGVAQAQEGGANQVCSLEKGWKPTAEELKQILSDHQEWVERLKEARNSDKWVAQNPEGRANLCNANLAMAELEDVNLAFVRLENAHLPGAKLSKADLSRANLNNAYLVGADLSHAYLVTAELNSANLGGAKLDSINFSRAKLNKADLTLAKLDNANLSSAELNNADLSGAKLNNANLFLAKLHDAILVRSEVKDAQLAYSEMTRATYAPASPPPSAYVAGISNLDTVTFPKGQEIGVVQLRDLLQKAGLRDSEREATYAIERGKTQYALDDWRKNQWNAAEGLFRLVAFEWTTAYGLHPGRALAILTALWALLIPVYWWIVRDHFLWLTGIAGIYRIWPKDRIEVHQGVPVVESGAKVERLRGSDLAALGWSAWFSLLSAFHIGFREFSVGTWLSRVHPRQFTLEATGWVRTVSGLQSLVSLYLLAMWVLTYFGRPFQ